MLFFSISGFVAAYYIKSWADSIISFHFFVQMLKMDTAVKPRYDSGRSKVIPWPEQSHPVAGAKLARGRSKVGPWPKQSHPAA